MSKINQIRKQRDRYIRAMEHSHDALEEQLKETKASLSLITRYLAALVERNGGTVTISPDELEVLKSKAFSFSFAEDGSPTFTLTSSPSTGSGDGGSAADAKRVEAETSSQPLTIEVQPPVVEFTEQSAEAGGAI